MRRRKPIATGNVEWEEDIYKLGEDEPYKKYLERYDCKEMVDYIQKGWTN